VNPSAEAATMRLASGPVWSWSISSLRRDVGGGGDHLLELARLGAILRGSPPSS
jgi:hypothetical protein